MEGSPEMRDFIEVYKCMPELWNCKLETYKNKAIRNRSYYKLLAEYKKIKSDASLAELKAKIANMRTCYRRELKKVVKSEKSGAGVDDIYVSNLWYYDAFDFLRDLEMPQPGCSTMSSDENEENKGRSQTSKRSTVDKERINFLKRATEHLEASSKAAKVEDEADVYANGWACMYRQMSSDQQLFAKKAIDEILILGRLSQLTFNSVQNGLSVRMPSRSSTPVSVNTQQIYLSDDSAQFVQAPIYPSGRQPFVNIEPEQVMSVAHSYSDFSELLSDTQYQ